ncbi:MAG: class I SAM-dependent methyltransferase [Anaerolineae bacterium]|nr:class I SAM-dependent methyltransferase [Anaerolineae bacterium]
MSDEQWTEADSQLYRQLAAVAVPDRVRQIAALLMLLPFDRNEGFTIAELAAGEGRLSAAVLQAFPHARLIALDGSEMMREEMSTRLQPFTDRFEVHAFDMANHDWYDQIDGVDAVVSSLCVHHLSAAGKRDLFEAMQTRLSARGVLLLADLMEPQRAEVRRFFAADWDESAQQQSTDNPALFDTFLSSEWNYYYYPSSIDTPSPLFHQLRWLSDAGFAVVDCFWMQAGHAIYGGYQQATSTVTDPITYEDALAAARFGLR